MIILYTLIALVGYPVCAYIVYTAPVYGIGAGILMGCVFPLAAMELRHAPTDLYMFGVFWDFVILASYMLIPVAMGKIHMDNVQWFGVAMAVTGMILMRGVSS